MSQKAVIIAGSKQYIVAEKDIIDVELVGDEKTVSYEPLLVFDEKTTKVGKPTVKGAKVSAKVLEEVKADKVTSIRFKAKKRVRKIHGHRQRHSRIQITKISA